MKQVVDETSRWWNKLLMKQPVDETSSWWNSKLMKQVADKAKNYETNNWVKTVDEMTSWQSDLLINQPAYYWITFRQNLVQLMKRHFKANCFLFQPRFIEVRWTESRRVGGKRSAPSRRSTPASSRVWQNSGKKMMISNTRLDTSKNTKRCLKLICQT